QEMTAYQSGVTDDFAWEDEALTANESEKRGDVHLPENFRLLRNLVGFVNLVFKPLMGTVGLNEFEVAYEPLIQGRANDQPGDVEILLGSKGKAGENGRGDSDAPPSAENALVAARIRHLVGTKATVWERNGDGEVPREIRYGDIAILLRSRTRLPEIESALLQAKIPYKITGGIGFYQRQEIYDICNYLQFLVNPDDNMALVGILRAPFFGVSDVELYEIAQEAIAGSFWQKVQAYAAEQITAAPHSALEEERGNPIQYAAETLQNHLAVYPRLAISTLIRKIVNDTGMVGSLSIGLQGEQRWANYEKLLGIAREFERIGFTDLPDFLERLNMLIEEEEREGQASTQLTEDAVQVMTVHAAKGLEFPVVILPQLERRFRYDQEPFIDDALGIGFSPANPERNYEKSDPAATTLMKERARNKTVAEEKRLFYVAATRARDRLILSGTLNRKGEADGWFNWLIATPGLAGIPQIALNPDSIGEAEIKSPVTIEALSGDGTTPVSFDLPIRVIRSLDALDFVEEDTPPSPPPAEFPPFHLEPLRPSPTGETFSVTDLATHSHCPTKFYLKHRLHVPADVGQAALDETSLVSHLDHDGTARGTAVHDVLAQLQTREDCERDLESLICAAVNATGEVVSAQTVREHVQGFLRSEIGATALNAQESHCEQHIYAQIGSHVINGVADRLFKDSSGLWHLIDYKTDAIDWSELDERVDYHRPQLELYALLIHRLFPKQPAIPVTIFFTHLATAYSMRLTLEALTEIEEKWIQRIEAIQEGRFEQNSQHCPLCPYFVDEECLRQLS
ncbi:MAG: PD-(D/E)XK nuclease family protein, partial [Candidatus Poribacteria bacterium]|nr:PD-(D/E)XK nuclease family protein [Candidatus Poribacteria bacterium]